MKLLARFLSFFALSVAAVCVAPQAEAARIAIGVGIGVPIGGYGYYGPAYEVPYYGPRYVYYPAPVAVVQAAPQQAILTAPDPIFYPRNGQTPAQSEMDRQDCNSRAASQPGALSDADVFQRASYACMDGRGYTVK